jgi:hypothetical protein
MGLFQKILEKIGLRKEKSAGAEVEAPKTTAAAKPAAASTAAAKPASSVSFNRAEKDDMVPAEDKKSTPAAPVAISEVDVVANLEKLAAASPVPLNWKVSIVDLLKLLGLDSSFDARKELATELDCPAELMGDSAKMNTWLHKTVLKKIAENGGNIPQELLD